MMFFIFDDDNNAPEFVRDQSVRLTYEIINVIKETEEEISEFEEDISRNSSESSLDSEDSQYGNRALELSIGELMRGTFMSVYDVNKPYV